MSEELRPCPFCGTLPQANAWIFRGISETRYFCPNQECPLSVRTVTLEQWNTRPIEDVLTARIAELEAERRWIPVSERLPEETGLYLVWQDGSFAVGCRVLYYSAGRSYLDFEWEIVTHWIPLPARPEVQE